MIYMSISLYRFYIDMTRSEDGGCSPAPAGHLEASAGRSNGRWGALGGESQGETRHEIPGGAAQKASKCLLFPCFSHDFLRFLNDFSCFSQDFSWLLIAFKGLETVET